MLKETGKCENIFILCDVPCIATQLLFLFECQNIFLISVLRYFSYSGVNLFVGSSKKV